MFLCTSFAIFSPGRIVFRSTQLKEKALQTVLLDEVSLEEISQALGLSLLSGIGNGMNCPCRTFCNVVRIEFPG